MTISRATVALMLAMTILLAGCGATPSASTARPPITGDLVASSLKTAGLPISNLVVYTADTDPNHLLGRPNQYTAKISWHDDRQPAAAGVPESTLELFGSQADLQARAEYTGAISKSGAAFAQYIDRNDGRLALMRLPHELTPDQAAAYQAWLKIL